MTPIPPIPKREEIKCPWDNDGNSHRVRTITGDGDWWAFCECSARGPVRATEEEAVAAWNQWTRSLVVVRSMNGKKPIDVMCPACKAPAGHPCCPFSRNPAPPPMKGFHKSRKDRKW